MNYFSVIDQTTQINYLLHFHSCFTFEFSHSAVMISYLNSSSQCMNFRRRGLVWKSVAILFSLNAKIILWLKYRHNNVTKVELDYQENHTLYLHCRSFLKNANWMWKLQSDLHDFIKFFSKRQLLLLLLPTTSATKPSNYDVMTFEMK